MVIAPSLLIFFFHLINNWPKFAFFIFEYSFNEGQTLVEIHWLRPRLNGQFAYVNQFANTPKDFMLNFGLTKFSVCASVPQRLRNSTLKFEWNIQQELSNARDRLDRVTRYYSENSCELVWKAPFQAKYHVILTARLQSNNKIVLSGTKQIEIKDYWIASIGDSFASGEGNPDIPAGESNSMSAKWISDQCHRSSRSWAFKVFERLLNSTSNSAIHFTYLPCTGASVDNGILVCNKGESQMDIVQKISKLRGSGPDILLMSAGGNDIGYSEILTTLILGQTNALFASIDMRFFYASYQFDKLAATLREIKPSQVVIPHYFDLTRNERGVVDANCAEMRQISTANLILAEKKILQRINKLISKKAQAYGWTVIDGVSDLFRSRGFCSTKSLIRSVRDSLRLQGNSFGAFHPIEEAHQSIADLVWSKLKALID